MLISIESDILLELDFRSVVLVVVFAVVQKCITDSVHSCSEI